MITNVERWQNWEDRYVSMTKRSPLSNLRLLEQMLEEARRVGAWKPFSWEELDHTLLLAKRINVPMHSD